MKFDTPASANPIDALKVVGKPVDRIDGPLKTTGTARYAYEHHADLPSAPAYGFVVGAAIARGRISSMKMDEALASPGVITVVTAANAGKLGKGSFNVAKLFGGPDVQHYHQAVALVVARTFEQARHAASLLRIDYVPTGGAFDLERARDHAGLPAPNPFDGPPQTAVGDFSGAFASAATTLDATYTTPDQSHAMMEPHASIAWWEGDRVSLWTSNQMVAWSVGDVAATLGLAPGKVRLMSPYVGGGFGAKLFVRTDAILAALGAKAARRPVKVALQRPLVINNTTHRPATHQRIRLGADRDGRLAAIAHETWSGNLPGGGPETAANQTRLLYAGANRLTATRVALLDLPEGNAMRAPGEAPGLMALEIAMDEMAEKLGLDPVDFRALNDTQVDPEKPARRFSQRQLVQCMRLGAERFGWSRRHRQPGQVREGRWLVGQGMAAAIRNHLNMKSAARVRLDGRGHVTVETDMTDIGTGSYTILAQTAAEMMGVRIEDVTVRLGDSAYPVSSGSGGQFGAANSTSGLYAACVKLREQVVARLGLPQTATFSGGHVVAGERSIALGRAAEAGELVAEDAIDHGDLGKTFQQSTFGAHFVEVGVDAATGEIRVRRMLAVCAAGRILNPKTARSQVIGAMTMGVGAALMEDLVVDKRRGFFVNHDLASYEVPVHADIPHQEVLFLDEVDPTASPMKAKGIGELGLCGVAAAVANAVYNATGVRVRDYPLTLDKLLAGLPAIA